MRLLAAVLVLVLGFGVRAYLGPSDPQAIRDPTPAASESTPVARGKVLYERYGCALCHGADGKGGFLNSNAETDSKVPAVIYVKEGYTPAEVAGVIRNGKPHIGRADPKGPVPPYRMPGWADRMTEPEVTDLVQYLMSLYPKAAAEQWR